MAKAKKAAPEKATKAQKDEPVQGVAPIVCEPPMTIEEAVNKALKAGASEIIVKLGLYPAPVLLPNARLGLSGLRGSKGGKLEIQVETTATVAPK